MSNKKICILLLSIAILLILLIRISSSLPSEIQDKKIDAEVSKELEKNEKVKVIISLNNSLASISAELTKEEINSLALKKEIKKIDYDFPMSAFLQDSAPLINATPVWQKQISNLNLTGFNQTICIIDTGINYNHSDLGSCYGNNNASSPCKVLGGYDFVNEDSDPMDDNSHGTHVAGIAAANSSILGIAPSAKLIAIKALDSGGNGVTSDIVSGIDWCVSNSSLFNIKVISLSLGTTSLYSSYCDSSFTSLASSINSAVAKNISVVVATGNSGPGIPRNTTAIASPACIQNSTSVSATNKDDSIASYAHYSSFTDLFAPGTSINSTNYLGGYLTDSGTSMSAPHVAGAIALLKQYLSLTNKTLSASQIKNSLKNNGKNITVPAGFNISRINVYSALISLDTDSPSVALSSPSDGFSSLLANQTFSCNATDLALKNSTFFLWNFSALVNQTTFASTGQSSTTQINISSLPVDSYVWNCGFYDENNNFALASSNFTFSIASLLVSLSSPANNLTTNQNQTFACNASSTIPLANATFSIWNSSSSLLKNESFSLSGLANSSSFSFNFTSQGTYYWNCLFTTNTSSGSQASSNFSVTYDLVSPSLTIISPQNNSWHNNGFFNVTISEQGSCIYSLNQGITNYSLSSENNLSFYSQNTSLLQDSRYNVTFFCNDSASNTNSSQLIFFNIDKISPNVSLISPSDGYSATGTATIDFIFNVSDNLNISSCSLILNSVPVAQNSSPVIQNSSNTISYSLSPNSYTWQINCTDQANNIGNSSQRTITINSALQTSSASPGSGGSSPTTEQTSNTFVIPREEISQGSTREIKKSDIIKFSITVENQTTNHSLIIENLTENSANITLKSSPVNLILSVGQSVKLNLTTPRFNDLFIKLNSITNKKANITIKNIQEPLLPPSENLPVYAFNDSSQNTSSSAPPQENNYEKYAPYLKLIVLIIILALLYAAIIYDIKHHKPNKKSKSISSKKSSLS